MLGEHILINQQAGLKFQNQATGSAENSLLNQKTGKIGKFYKFF